MHPDFDKIRNGINNGRFRYLGHGFGRNVYDLGNGTVVKVARNGFGIYENKNEYQLSQLYKCDLLAKVVSVSNGYKMLVMQAARVLNDIRPILDHFNVKTKIDLFFVPELRDLAEKCHLVMIEFTGPGNWGLIGGKPVIIDYGFVWRGL